MQAEPGDHEHRQQQEGDDAKQARRQQRVSQRRRSDSLPATESLKRSRRRRTTVLGDGSTDRSIRNSLPSPGVRWRTRHFAAVAAGGCHADLRVASATRSCGCATVRCSPRWTPRTRLRGACRRRRHLGFRLACRADAGVAAATAAGRAVARALRALNREHRTRRRTGVHRASWVSDYRIDPFAVPASDKIALLGEYSGRLLAADGVDHVTASLQVKEQTFYADHAGSSIMQQRVRLHPKLEATTVDQRPDVFETMRTLAPPSAGDGSTSPATGCGTGPRTRPDAGPAGREGEGAHRGPGPHRPGDRPDEPVADDPRIHRARHRIRPRHRLRGRVCRHVVRHPRQARHAALRDADDARDRGPHRGTVSPRSATTTKASRRSAGTWCATDSSSATSWTGRSRRGSGWRGPTVARTPTRRITSRFSGWPTCRCSPIPTTQHRRPDLPCGGRNLHRRRQVLVDRHAALQLPVHRSAVLPDPRREARRAAARRRVPGDDHRLLGCDGGRRRPLHLAARRRIQLRQGATRPGRGGQPRLPVGTLPRRQRTQHSDRRGAGDDRRTAGRRLRAGRGGPGQGRRDDRDRHRRQRGVAAVGGQLDDHQRGVDVAQMDGHLDRAPGERGGRHRHVHRGRSADIAGWCGVAGSAAAAPDARNGRDAAAHRTDATSEWDAPRSAPGSTCSTARRRI